MSAGASPGAGAKAAVASRGRILVAMSGGVDSSVAAALALREGYEPVGVTLQLTGGGSRCCSLADADDARRVARRLGIRHFVANHAEEFRREVMEPFADAYLAGRTPIPCVTCNSRFKFDLLLERARVFDAERVASGHYARVERDPATGLFHLLRAADVAKDQTYFLFGLTQAQLAAAHFPLGGLLKSEVRAVARELGLETAEKPESQGICFVPEGETAGAVEALRPGAAPGEGEIVDREGRRLGRHSGIHHFTVGQRRGLRLSAGRRLYVAALDAARNRVVVGEGKELETAGARLSGVSWIAGAPPAAPVRARVCIRYRHAGAWAEVAPRPGGAAELRFEAPVRAVARGQAAVFYQGDAVLGGGWIEGPLA